MSRIVDTMSNCEFELPEDIIHRIQSFLTGKEAAQTITLSKSWHGAWLTRPNLDFDETDYFSNTLDYEEQRRKKDEFFAFAKKTIQRYEDSNLKVESFRLKIIQNPEHSNLANKLIVKALKLCASLVSLEIVNYFYGPFVIAPEVFESESLLGLSVKGGKIDIGTDHNVRCFNLVSLSLNSVVIGSGVISNIVSSCPLVQNLSLSYLPVPINLPKLPNLKSLTLFGVKLESLFLDDLSSKFPALKHLTLDGVCRSYQEEEEEEIRVSSCSLEHLNVTPKYSTSMFKFDVPSIKKFVIKACFIPSLSFESTSEEWESHASINIQERYHRYSDWESDSADMGHCNLCSNSWFLALNEFLTALSPSNINLSISVSSDTCFDYEVRDLQGLPQPRVENLTVDIQFLQSLNCYALFDGLFRICCPQLITQYRYPKPDKKDCGRHIYDFLFKILEQGMNGEFSSPRSFVHDLKEVFVQFLDDDDIVAVRPWKPLAVASDFALKPLAEASEITLKPLAEASEITLKPKQKTRFQLVWK